MFTQAFYTLVLTEGKRVCEAFQAAVERIKLHNELRVRNDWPNFILFSRCDA